uniref:Ras-associating and dilute domain-containing protein n=1 Tax=Ciona intestinalis TaxID=7719 RepID=F6Q5A8_CIOIN
ELSSDANLPGIMKIFGDAISPGANYKSVMATRESSALELVKTAVKRYGLQRQHAKKYILCEVIGRLTTENIPQSRYNGLKEDYIRPLNDHERPLKLQSYWKPLDGHCRRFEIRLKSELQVLNAASKDNETRDINSQAKRLVMQKSNYRGRLKENDGTCCIYTTIHDLIKLLALKSRKPKRLKTLPCPTEAKLAHETKSAETCSFSNEITPPPPVPYLLTVLGDTPEANGFQRFLERDEILVGSEVSDFKLKAPGVLRHHCVIRRHLETLFDETKNFKATQKWRVVVSPLKSRAEVTVNGVRVLSNHTLTHGDILCIGKSIIYKYEDPTSSINIDCCVVPSPSAKNRKEILISSDVTEKQSSVRNYADITLSSPFCPEIPAIMETQLSYERKYEDEILDQLFDIFSNFCLDNMEEPLAPANFLCHMITHACLNFDLADKNESLFKVASHMQTFVLNATRKVSVQDIQSNDPSEHLLKSLRLVVFWMSNTLEIFEFLQKDLIPHVLDCVEEAKKNSKILDEAKKFEINEEILGLLEEVVMYAFQQLVYYLTKTLYGSLPAILDCNPFSDVESTPSVNHVIKVYNYAWEMTQTYLVNQQIADQLFAYLFFFTNVSLFNTLMENDASTKYFKWEMGVRIRGNLEKLENWAIEFEYSYQVSAFLVKISTLANLLATPRTQMAKYTWSTFRKNFHGLNSAQLCHVLECYQMTGQQQKPTSWFPDQEVEMNTSGEDAVMESYESHPPLTLPVSGSRINLGELPNNPKLQNLIASFKHKVYSPHTEQLCKEFKNEKKQSFLSNELKVTMPTSPDVVPMSYPDLLPESESSAANVASSGGFGRIVSSSSSCSSSSEPEAYIVKNWKYDEEANASKAINKLAEELRQDCDSLLVLPVAEIESFNSRISKSTHHEISSPADTSVCSDNSMPKEVFIVDIKKGKQGLGVGLVDGTITSLGLPGIFVRSLIPDGPSVKEGRLQLGDRILAANGVSLINMSYHEAMRAVWQAGDNIRLLVGRCGSDVAIKITSSSC